MKRCGNCGSTSVVSTNIKGRKFAWMDYPSVTLRFEHWAPVCSHCQNIILDMSDGSKLDDSIVKSIQSDISEAIQTLTKEVGLSQEQLAKALGITPQYLSMVKSHQRKMSFTVFSLLQIYRDYPREIEMRTQIKVPSKLSTSSCRLETSYFIRGYPGTICPINDSSESDTFQIALASFESKASVLKRSPLPIPMHFRSLGIRK